MFDNESTAKGNFVRLLLDRATAQIEYLAKSTRLSSPSSYTPAPKFVVKIFGDFLRSQSQIDSFAERTPENGFCGCSVENRRFSLVASMDLVTPPAAGPAPSPWPCGLKKN
jgi:hypothetical protein